MNNGKWKVKSNGHVGVEVYQIQEGDRLVATACSSDVARLIAAAPDLLSASKFAVECLTILKCDCVEINGHRDACPRCQALSEIEAAITKANGGSK